MTQNDVTCLECAGQAYCRASKLQKMVRLDTAVQITRLDRDELDAACVKCYAGQQRVRSLCCRRPQAPANGVPLAVVCFSR